MIKGIIMKLNAVSTGPSLAPAPSEPLAKSHFGAGLWGGVTKRGWKRRAGVVLRASR